ncbi:MAG: phosphotransferase enzyme family protein [Opitutales bacterium]
MSATPVPSHFADVLAQYELRGRHLSAAPYGSGHINDTYVVNCAPATGQPVRYIAQRINDRVFKNVPALMENVQRVTAHLKRRAGPASRQLALVPARDGGASIRDALGGWWRLYDFIEGAHTVDRVTGEAQARVAAQAFGDFQAQLTDLPGGRLQETIPNFHHTRSRFENFRRAVQADQAGRAAGVAPEIAFAFSREADADVLLGLLAQGEVSERVTHNDTKINNVMLDDATQHAVAVIDLDTVMPGLPLYDFGEMVRTSASSTFEDDPHPENMRLELLYFRVLVEGYLASAVGAVLNATERAHLGFAGKLMTYENGLRFLTDYLQGDIYYKIQHPRHNLDRCRTQFALVRSIEAQRDALTRILDSAAKSGS